MDNLKANIDFSKYILFSDINNKTDFYVITIEEHSKYPELFRPFVKKLEEVDGEIINLGTDEVNTTQEGITAVEQIMGMQLIIDNKPARKGDQQRTAAVIDKARNMLSYSPKITLKKGLEAQVKWYKEKFID